MRAFIAIEVAESVRRRANEFIVSSAKHRLPVKWVAFENLHITLKFLGEIDAGTKDSIVPAVAAACRTISRFAIRLAGVGCFPGPRNPRVLWIGVKDGEQTLCHLAGVVDGALQGFGVTEDKKFHAHLTIGRVRKPCNVDNILQADFQSDPFEIGAVTLFQSTLRPAGPVYDVLERFPLG